MALAEAYLAAVPVHWGQAGTLLLASVAIMGSPGPATISLTAAGSAYGVRQSARYLTGIIAGTTAVLAAVATGVTVTLLAVPALRAILAAASAAYILWLAYHIATAPPTPRRPLSDSHPRSPGERCWASPTPKPGSRSLPSLPALM